jgi:hypothetical protein
MEKRELKIVLEGITINHAGEIIFDSPKTTKERGKFPYTYLRSLEDFMQAVIFADKIVVSSRLPDVGNESPGKDLLAMFDPKMIEWVEEVKGFSPDSVLDNESNSSILGSYLKNLNYSYFQDPGSWREFIMREYITYFYPKGRDKVLYENGKFLFGKNYMEKSELESLISADFIKHLIEPIQRLSLNESNIPPQKALEDFIRKTSLTHVVIGLYYKQFVGLIKVPEFDRNFISHVTRSTLKFDQHECNLKERTPWLTLIPRLIAPTLKLNCTTRFEIPNAIKLVKHNINHDDDLKEMFSDAVHLYQIGDRSRLDVLKKYLESLYPDMEKRGLNFMGSYRVNDEVDDVAIGHDIENGRNVNLVQDYSTSFVPLPERYEAYEKEAYRLFKELR